MYYQKNKYLTSRQAKARFKRQLSKLAKQFHLSPTDNRLRKLIRNGY